MPYSGGRPKEGDAIQPLHFAQQQRDMATRIIDLVNSNAPAAQIEEAKQQFAEAIGGDRFQVMRMLPHFIQAAAKNVDAAQVYEHFRLPGRERIVHDRREDGKAEGKEERAPLRDAARAELAKDMEIREGKLVRHEGRAYENYLGERTARGAPAERAELLTKVERLLSASEQLVVERFEGGRDVARESADGRARFLPKTEAQWKEFFSKFMDRLIAKRVSIDEIREFLFRGLVPKGNKGVVISDMVLADGRVEKFVRFGVLAEVMAQLKALLPGDVFGRDRLGTMGEDLLYLALAVSRGKDIATSPLPSAGKFISGTAEERAAQELGIPVQGQSSKGAQRTKGGRRAPFTGLFDREGGEPEDLPYQFIPWWHWANLKRPTKSKWATILFYIALLAMGLLGIGVLTYRLISGGL